MTAYDALKRAAMHRALRDAATGVPGDYRGVVHGAAAQLALHPQVAAAWRDILTQHLAEHGPEDLAHAERAFDIDRSEADDLRRIEAGERVEVIAERLIQREMIERGPDGRWRLTATGNGALAKYTIANWGRH